MKYPVVLGVFARRLVMEIGSGTTMVDHKNVTYWYVRQVGDERLECQPLASGGLPSGMTNRIPMGEFIRKHTPEPTYYVDNPLPALDSLAAKVLDEASCVEILAGLDDDEMTVLKAILVDAPALPNSTSPEYVAGCAALLEVARAVLNTLLSRSPAAKFEHRTRLSGFGVKLRKGGQLDESISYFSKAIDIEKNDENLHFNLARVFYDKGDMSSCRQSLDEALRINPVFPEAGKFVSYLKRKARKKN